jgi:Fe-S cluster assembly protein SufD
MTTTLVSDRLESAETFGQAAFDRLLEKRIDPVWLSAKRKEAWDTFQSLDWPNPRDENWMRSDFRGLKLSKFAPNLEESVQIAEGTPVRLLEGVDVSASCRSVNGLVVSEALDEKLAARGVVVGSLSRCARDHSALVERYLHSLICPKSDRFAALQASMWSDGFFVYVPRNVAVDHPIHLHASLADGQVDLSHTLIVLEQGAEATVLFESASPDASAKGFHCGGVELIQHGM